MNNNDNLNLSTAYTNALSDSLSVLRESINAAFAPLTTPQFTQIASEALSESLNQFSSVLTTMARENIDFNIFKDAIYQFSQYLPDYNFSSLTEGITVTNDCVTLTDDTVETLSNLLNEADEKSTATISSKMSISEYIAITITVICALAPMLQNSYYHKLDAIESQQNQMQVAEYQEAILNLEVQYAQELEELNSNINELLQYLESVQDTDSLDADAQSLLPNVQDTIPDSLSAEIETDDEPDNHDTNQSSN